MIFSLISAGVCGVGGSVEGAAVAAVGLFSFSSIFGLGDFTFCGVLTPGVCSVGLSVSPAGGTSLSAGATFFTSTTSFFCVEGISSSSSSSSLTL